MVRVFVEGLQPGREYSAQFRSVFNGDYSEYSPVLGFTASADEEPPQVPTGIVALFTGDAVYVKWNALDINVNENKDLSHYEIQYSRAVEGSTAVIDPKIIGVQKSDSPSHTLSFAENEALWGIPQARINVLVRSVDATGNASEWSEGTVAVNPAPGQVLNLEAQVGRELISLRWEAPADTDLQNYQIHRGTEADFTTTANTLVGVVTSLNFDDQVFQAGQYWHKVFSVDKFGQRSVAAEVGPNSPIIGAAVDATPPAVPADLTASINQVGLSATATITWTPVADSDLDTYILRYREAGTSNWSEIQVSRDTTTYVLDLPKSYTNYEFQIRAKDFSANYSGWSSTITANAPANVAPGQTTGVTVAGGKGQVTVKWTLLTDPDIQYYQVQVSTNSSFTNIVADQKVNADSLNISGLTGGQTYHVRVRAVDLQGANGQWSDSGSATPTGFGASFADLEAGTLQAKELRLGLGASMVVDSTAVIKSNTYSGSFDPVAGTGWSLANNSLVVNEGSISAKAFKAGTIESAIIKLGTGGELVSSNYQQNVAGFRLTNNTLDIVDGTISAKALNLQVRGNIIHPLFASFESNMNTYFGRVTPENGLWGIGSAFWKYSDSSNPGQSMAIFSAPGQLGTLYLGATTTDYNVEVESEEVNYFFGAELHSVPGTTAKIGLKLSDGTELLSEDVTIPANSGNVFTNVTRLFTIPNGITKVLPFIRVTTAGGAVDIDGVLLVRQTGKSTTPPLWTRPGMTSVDGGQIRTGEIWSNATTTVDGKTVPLWYINLGGEAQFGTARVLGSLVVGGTGVGTSGAVTETTGNSFIRSSNYVANTSGYILKSDGYAEFSDMKLRGGLISGSIQLASGGELKTAVSNFGSQVILNSDGLIMKAPDRGVTQNLAYDIDSNLRTDNPPAITSGLAKNLTNDGATFALKSNIDITYTEVPQPDGDTEIVETRTQRLFINKIYPASGATPVSADVITAAGWSTTPTAGVRYFIAGISGGGAVVFRMSTTGVSWITFNASLAKVAQSASETALVTTGTYLENSMYTTDTTGVTRWYHQTSGATTVEMITFNGSALTRTAGIAVGSWAKAYFSAYNDDYRIAFHTGTRKYELQKINTTTGAVTVASSTPLNNNTALPSIQTPDTFANESFVWYKINGGWQGVSGYMVNTTLIADEWSDQYVTIPGEPASTVDFGTVYSGGSIFRRSRQNILAMKFLSTGTSGVAARIFSSDGRAQFASPVLTGTTEANSLITTAITAGKPSSSSTATGLTMQSPDGDIVIYATRSDVGDGWLSLLGEEVNLTAQSSSMSLYAEDAGTFRSQGQLALLSSANNVTIQAGSGKIIYLGTSGTQSLYVPQTIRRTSGNLSIAANTGTGEFKSKGAMTLQTTGGWMNLLGSTGMTLQAYSGNIGINASGNVVINPGAQFSVTATGNISMTTGSTGADVAITAAPTGALWLNKGTNASHGRFGMNESNLFYVQHAGATSMSIDTVGIYANSLSGRSVVANSSNRLGYTSSSLKMKRDIVPACAENVEGFEVAPGLKNIWGLDLVAFNYKEEELGRRRQFGVIAEQAHDLGLAALVYYTDEENPSYDDIDGFAYERHSVWLQAATKLRFEENEARMDALEAENSSLKERLDALESLLQGQN